MNSRNVVKVFYVTIIKIEYLAQQYIISFNFMFFFIFKKYLYLYKCCGLLIIRNSRIITITTTTIIIINKQQIIRIISNLKNHGIEFIKIIQYTKYDGSL